MAEGRYKRYYVPVPPSVKLKLDPAMVEAWLKDDDVADEELRLKLKEGLKAFKAANGTKVMADCRKAWRAATAA
jgi:hypothetical protein